MTESYSFFGGTPDDPRQYTQTDFAEVLKRLFKNGYFPGVESELRVTPTDPARLAVRVAAGQAWINGYWYKNDAWKEIDLAAADESNARIDRIVLRLDTVNARNIEAVVKTGTPASNPSAPGLERTDQIYEISLAMVRVNSGASSITASSITDTRDNESVCGQAVPWNVPTDADLSDVAGDLEDVRDDFNDHETDNLAHNATHSALANRIMSRDSSGRTSVATPTQDINAANKGYVDSSISSATANMARTNAVNNFSNSQYIDGGEVYRAWGINRTVDDDEVRASMSVSSSGGAELTKTVNGTIIERFGVYGVGDARLGSDQVWTEGNLPNPASATTLNNHINDNTRHITAQERSNWNAKETPQGAQQKVDQATANMAETNVDNNFTQSQTVKRDGDYLFSGVRRDVSGTEYGVEIAVAASGASRLTRREGGNIVESINIMGAGDARLGSNPIWTNGNQGNPNNLNTASKQIIGSINELFTTVSNGKQEIRDAIADAGGTAPSGSPDQYTHQQLANAISTVAKHAEGSTPAQTNVQIRGINFDANVLTGDYQTSDSGAVSFTIIYFPEAGGFSRLFVNKSSTTAADPIITKVSGGFNITLDRPAGTSFDWEAWGGRP